MLVNGRASSITLKQSTLDRSEAGTDGGGFYITDSSTVTVLYENTNFNTFTAGSNGGVGYFSGTVFTYTEKNVNTQTTKATGASGGKVYWTGSSSALTI